MYKILKNILTIRKLRLKTIHWAIKFYWIINILKTNKSEIKSYIFHIFLSIISIKIASPKKLKLLKILKIHDILYILLLKPDSTTIKLMNENNMIKLNTSNNNNRKYKIKAI